MNSKHIFPFQNEEEKAALILLHSSDKVLIEVLGYEGGGNGELTFSDMAQEKYIKNLEDQLLLLADELNGGIL